MERREGFIRIEDAVGEEIAECVGRSGRVYAVDLQGAAIEATRW